MVSTTIKPITLCHVIHSGAVGGGPRILKDAVELAREHGFHNIVVCGRDGPLVFELTQMGVETHVLSHTGKWSFGLSLLPLVRLLRVRGVGATLLYGQFSGFYGAIASRLAGVAAVYEAHFPSYVTDTGPLSRIRNFVAEFVSCRLSGATTVISQDDLEEYRRRGLQAPERLHLVPNGVGVPVADPEEVETLRHTLLSGGDCLLLAAGRMEDQKGFDILLSALPPVVQRYPGMRLALVGEGPQRDALRANLVELGLTSTVKIHDFQHSLDAWILAADIVVVPSRYEPGGLVAREALAAGKAVVASSVQGLADAIDDGKTGLLVPPGDPQRLASALMSLLADPGLRRHLGGAARVAASYFSREAMWTGYEQVIVGLISGTS
jgi:glycosyltransferase involved in cell wall biosynthesis